MESPDTGKRALP